MARKEGSLKIPIGTPGKKICFGVESGGAVANGVLMAIYVGGPPGLAWRKYAGCLEILEGLVVGTDAEWLMTGFKVDVPVSNSIHYGEHLSVAYAVSEFGWCKLSGIECDRVLGGGSRGRVSL